LISFTSLLYKIKFLHYYYTVHKIIKQPTFYISGGQSEDTQKIGTSHILKLQDLCETNNGEIKINASV